MQNKAHINLLKQRYGQALSAGDADEARRVVDDAIDRGIGQASIYFGIFAPALADIGDAWISGELNIAAEHHATSITLREIGRVGEIGRSNRKRENGGTVIVAAVEGEMHWVGIRMISELFQMDGWNVADLGQDNPIDDLAKLVKQRQPDLVVLSLTRPDRIPVARKAARMLKELENGPVVFVGGPEATLQTFNDDIHADLVSANPLQAINEASKLISDRARPVTLNEHLVSFGIKVLRLRRHRGWTQQELARRASLDRTYISNVEKGRQNITIGAAVKIANALDSNLADLIDRN